MFQKEDCFCVGRITRLHGFKGDVSILFDVSNPQEFKGLESVFVEIDNKLVPFFFERLAIRNQKSAVATFEKIDSEKKATALINCELYLPVDLMPKGFNPNTLKEFEGFEVIDKEKGSIGKVVQLLDYTNNPVFQIDFEGKEILVPKQDDFITKIDLKKKVIYIDAPDGLIDMYLGN